LHSLFVDGLFWLIRFCTIQTYYFKEGSAILSGLSFNGQGQNGEDQWDGVRDLHINKFELGSDFQSVIESFNCGTNTFAKNHIFRRLRWLGNKYISQAITLFYLAVWHGYHLGYFMLFAYEFACVSAQEQVYSLIRKSESIQRLLEQSWMKPCTWLFGRITINVSMAFGFLTFGLVKKEIWIVALKAMYFYGYVIYFVIWPIAYFILYNAFRSLHPSKKHDKDL
jgi:lysophospholipid acyltransferase 5